MNMGLELALMQSVEKPKEPKKRAADLFKNCPLCGDCSLIKVSGDVICSQCDWNSIAITVAANIEARAVRAQQRREQLALSERIGRHGRMPAQAANASRVNYPALPSASATPKLKRRRPSLKDRLTENPMIGC